MTKSFIIHATHHLRDSTSLLPISLVTINMVTKYRNTFLFFFLCHARQVYQSISITISLTIIITVY